jgi:hypothetical protein
MLNAIENVTLKVHYMEIVVLVCCFIFMYICRIFHFLTFNISNSMALRAVRSVYDRGS